MCDNCDIIAAMWHRAGSGTADHGVPDEVRRHRHHLPLPGLVSLHRGQQVDSMLCFSSYKTHDDTRRVIVKEGKTMEDYW